MRLAAMLVLAACWTGSPTPLPTSDPAADAPGCIYDERARHRCNGRGPGFDYGPEPYIYCRGIPPEPGDQARYEASQRTKHCVCNNAAELDERRRQCSQIP